MTAEAHAPGPVRLIETERRRDARGWFCEAYNETSFAAIGVTSRFVQDSHSFSRAAFTLRGLHFQTPPHAQDKLVRCVRGRIFDVAVDLRAGSPNYGRWVAAELSAENGRQLLIPAGFAHGFLTLEPETEVLYKVSYAYVADSDYGLRWDDQDIAVNWPLPEGLRPVLSPKDERLPSLRDLDSPFPYDGRPLGPLRRD